MNRPKPVLLLVLDGWGVSQSPRGNAIYQAHTPHWDRLIAKYPYMEIEGCGETVGLPDGQIGNSEVGHLTLGAGRIIYQDLTKINRAVEDRSFFEIPKLHQAFAHAQDTKHAVHIMGLLSPGGVHSHEDHILALLEHSKQYTCTVYVHAFLDGRDTLPKSALSSIQKLQRAVAHTPHAAIATVMGRFYAMDRDKRWERTLSAYEAIVQAKTSRQSNSAEQALLSAYDSGLTDEFVLPTLVDAEYPGVQPQDTVIFMNFRADRARQLCHALHSSAFNGFTRQNRPALHELITLTQYDDTLTATILFPKESPKNVLGEYLQSLKLRQLRIAETEKYAHVTFFFNGGIEQPFQGEERILIPSPKVATYDMQPEMNAPQLTESLIDAIYSQKFDVIICNFANADMVGHTGNFDAAVKAVSCLDSCLGKILAAIEQTDGAALITADHGNVECMYEADNQNPHTAHTLSKVPFVYFGRTPLAPQPIAGSLQDIAPTLLTIMGLPIPTEMTGKPLLRPINDD